MKKIAVICAYPAGENPGMLSVDLAFDAVAKALPEPVHLDRFCLEGALNALDSNYLFERLISPILAVIADRKAWQDASGVLDRQIDSAKRALTASLLVS